MSGRILMATVAALALDDTCNGAGRYRTGGY